MDTLDKVKSASEDLPSISDFSNEIFYQLLPSLVQLVNEKFVIEDKFCCEQPLNECMRMLKDFHRDFGEVLSAVYRFKLYPALMDEFLWLVSTLSYRGFKREYFEKMLNAWIIAMHGIIKPINSDELIQPLRFLVQHLDVFVNNWEISDELESDEQKGLLNLLLEKRRRDAMEYAVSFNEKGNSPDDICHDILMPVIKQIGLLWQKNEINVTDEHAATYITKYIVLRLFDRISRKPTIPYSSLVGCVPGEEHVLGADIVASHLEIEGWSVCYVGHGAPVEDILEIITKSSPDVVFLSNTLISKLPLAVELSKRLRKMAPKVKIIMGGHAALVAKDMFAKLVDAVIDDYRKADFEAIEILEGNA